MLIIALLSAVMVFCLIIALFGGSAYEKDRVSGRLRAIVSQNTEGEDNGGRGYSLKHAAARRRQKNKARLQRRQIDSTRNPHKVTSTEKMLQSAGIALSGNQFLLIRLGAGLGLALPAFYAGLVFDLGSSMAIPAVLAGFILGMLLPMRYVKSRLAKQQEIYREALPNVMDLLVVSVEAGLGLDAALLRLYEKDKSPLMQELIRAIQDVQRGMSKKEAYTQMAERCRVKELTSFVNALLQAEQLGISIKSVLKQQADAMRESRRQRAEEKALKAPVTMLMPLVMFIFPVIFIVLLGPAVINIMEIFGS